VAFQVSVIVVATTVCVMLVCALDVLSNNMGTHLHCYNI
jgi:hypothetical protein